MLLITAELGLPNIVDNHFPHFFTAVFVGQEVLGKCCCSDFGDVFVFGDGEHLLFGQIAERNTIFKRDHTCLAPAHLITE